MTDDGPTRVDLAAAARARLLESLDQVLGDLLRAEPGRRVPRSERLRVSEFDLGERCPRRGARPADDFVESATTARRRVGLLALRRLGDDACEETDLPAAVAAVLDSGEGLAPGLADWVADLDRAGKAAVGAAAVTWAASLCRTVGATRRPIRWSDPGPWTWDVPGRIVSLSAKVDATATAEVRGDVLLWSTGATDPLAQRALAAHLALVRALSTNRAPLRVTIAVPATGTMRRVPVDPDLLDLGVDRVVEHVALRARPDAAPARPGRACRNCHLLDTCPQGTDHLAAMTSGRPT
jgi:hypothetical protein